MMWRKTKFLREVLSACVLFAFGLNVMAQEGISQLPLPSGQKGEAYDRNGDAWSLSPTVGAYQFSNYAESVMLAVTSDTATGKVSLTLSRNNIDSDDDLDIALNLDKNDFYQLVNGAYVPCGDALTIKKGESSAKMDFFVYVALGSERKLSVILPLGVAFDDGSVRRDVVVKGPEKITLETGVENLSVVEGASNRFWIKSNLPLSPMVNEAQTPYNVTVELNKAINGKQRFDVKMPGNTVNKIYSEHLIAPQLLGRQFADGGEVINLKTVSAGGLEKANIGAGYVLSDARELSTMLLTADQSVVKPGATVDFKYKLSGSVLTNNSAEALSFPLEYDKSIFSGEREITLLPSASEGSFSLMVNASLNTQTQVGVSVYDPYVGVVKSTLLPIKIAPRANLGIALDWGKVGETTTSVYLPVEPKLYARVFDQETKLPFTLDTDVVVTFSSPSLASPFPPIKILKGSSFEGIALTNLTVTNNLSTYEFKIDDVDMTGTTTSHDKPTFIPSDRVSLNYFKARQIVYVNRATPAFTSAQNGQSWATAYETVQQALPSASEDPKQIEIRVAAGTYSNDIIVLRGVNLLCGYLAGTETQTEKTIFSDKVSVISLNASFPSRIENCSFAQVVSVGVNSTLKNIVIESQTRDTDILYINGGVVQNATLKKNKSTAGAVIRMVDGVIENSQIIGNQSTVNGGGVSLEKGLLLNNVIANNETSGVGGGVYATGDVSLINNTIVRNKSTSIGGASVVTPKSKLYNNVIWGNGSGDQIDPRKVAFYDNNALESVALGGQNIAISTDNKGQANSPCFITPSTQIGIAGVTGKENWGIDYASRLAATGSNNFVYAPAFDVAGAQRVLPNSIGAYEMNVLEKATIELTGMFNTVGHNINLTASMKKLPVREDVRIKLNYSDKLSLVNPPEELVIKAGQSSGVISIGTDVHYVGKKKMTITGELLTAQKVVSQAQSTLACDLDIEGKPLKIELVTSKDIYHDGELMKISAKLPRNVTFAESINVWVYLGDQASHFTLDGSPVTDNKILLQVKAYETTSPEIALRVVNVTTPLKATFSVEANDFIASGANTKIFDLRARKYYISIGATKSIYTQGELITLFAHLNDQMQNLTGADIQIDMEYKPELGGNVIQQTLSIQPNTGAAFLDLSQLSAGKYLVNFNEVLTAGIDSEVTQKSFAFEVVKESGLILSMTPKNETFTEGDRLAYTVKIMGDNGEAFVNNDTRIVYLTIPDTELKNTVDSFIIPIGASKTDVVLAMAKQYLGDQGIRSVDFSVDSIQLESTSAVDTFITFAKNYTAKIDDTVNPLAKVNIFTENARVVPGDSVRLICRITDNISDASSNNVLIPIGFSDSNLWELLNENSNKFVINASGNGDYELLLYPKFNYQSIEVLTDLYFSTHASVINVGTPKTQIVIRPAPKVKIALTTSVSSIIEGGSFDLIAQIVEPQKLYIKEGHTIQVEGQSTSTGANLLRPVGFIIILSRQLDGSFKGSTPIGVNVSSETIMRTATFELQDTTDYEGTNQPKISIISNKAPALSFDFSTANMWSDSYLFEGSQLQVTANLSAEYNIPQTIAFVFSDTIFDAPAQITFPANVRKQEFTLKAKDIQGFYGLRTSKMHVDSSQSTLLMQLPAPITLGVVDSPLVNIALSSANSQTIYEGDSFDITATLDQMNTNPNPIELNVTQNDVTTSSRFVIKTKTSTAKINYVTTTAETYQGPQKYKISVDTVGKPYRAVTSKTYTIYDRDITATFSVPDLVRTPNALVSVSLNKVNMSGKDVVVKLSSSVAGDQLISIAHGEKTASKLIEFQPLAFGNAQAKHIFKMKEIIGDNNGIVIDKAEKVLYQYPLLRVVGISVTKSTIRSGEPLDFYVTMTPANDNFNKASIKLALVPGVWEDQQPTVFIEPGKTIGRITLKSLDNMSEPVLKTTVRVVEVEDSVVKDPQKGEVSVSFTTSLPVVSFEKQSTSVTFADVDEPKKTETITLTRTGNLEKELYVNLSIVPAEGSIKLASPTASFKSGEKTAIVEINFENPKKAMAPIEAILSFKNESNQYIIDLNSTHALILNSTIDPAVYTGFATSQQDVTFAIKPQLLIVWGAADRIEVAVSGKGIKSNMNCFLSYGETPVEFNRNRYIVKRTNDETSTILHVDVDPEVLKTDHLAIKFKMTKATQGAWAGKVTINPLFTTHTLVLINDKPEINNDLFVYRHYVDSNPFVVFDPLKNDVPFVKENLSKSLIIEGVSKNESGPFESDLVVGKCIYRVTPDLSRVDMDYQDLSTAELANGFTHRLYYKVVQPGASPGVGFIDVSLGSILANQAIVPVSVNALSLAGNAMFSRAPAAYAMYYDRFKDPLLLKARKRTFSLERSTYPTSTIRLKVASLPRLYDSKTLSKAMGNGLHLSEVLANKHLLFQYDNLNMPIQIQLKGITGTPVANAQTLISEPAKVTIAETAIKDYSGYTLIELKGESFSGKSVVYLAYRKKGYEKVYRTKLPIMKSYKNVNRQKITFPVTDPVNNCSIFVRLPKKAPTNSVSYELQFENGVGYTAVESFDLNYYLNQK